MKTHSETVVIHDLWQTLTYEMADVFDAHGIYASVAFEIAQFTNHMTVTAVTEPQGKYYDVWIAKPNQRLHQTRWSMDATSLETFFKDVQAGYHDKFQRPAAELVTSDLWQLPHERILTTPLPMPNAYRPTTSPGLLCIIDPTAECLLTPANIEPLATNITVFLDRAHLRRHYHRQEVEFGVVSDISYALTASLSMQNIFNQLTDPVRRTLNVANISVALIDENTGHITFVDMLLGPMFDNLGPIRLKRGEGIAGWVAENREPVIINDVYSDRRFYRKVDSSSGFHTTSMICIPLQIENRVIGVLQALNKQDGDFQEHDLRLLQAIGGPLAAAIENARLHANVIAEKRRIETIFASMSEGMLTMTPAGIITQTNEALHTLLRRDTAALAGRNALETVRLKSGDLSDFMNRILNYDGGDYPQLATTIYQSDGELVPTLLSGAPVYSESGQVGEVIWVFSDLRQIREVERMRDDFFHGIIHELRTPLATILMYARLLREGKAKEKVKADRFLGVIERESDRLQKMVRQMLQLAKMGSREFQRSAEPVELNPIFEEMLPPMADRATEKGLAFRQRIEAHLPPVMGNQENFYLIFKNLVDNAIKFTMSGTVSIDVRLKNGDVVAIVSDEGIGIPEQALPNLFGRFFRAQTAVERGIAGTGLGLYMVKEGVESARGTIEVESQEGKGTIFTITLPSVPN